MPSNMMSSIFRRDFSDSDHNTGETQKVTGVISTIEYPKSKYFEEKNVRFRHVFTYLFVMTAWEVAGEYVYTTPGDQDTDYLMLTLNVPGYR